MTALEMLRHLLSEVNSDAYVIDRSIEPVQADRIVVDGVFVDPTHVILDADGDEVGSGMSEEAAIINAVRREYRWARDELERCRKAVRDYKQARAALDTV